MNEGKPLALVTGASSGIGYALARQFAEHGHDLVINAENGRVEHAARQQVGGRRRGPCRDRGSQGRCGRRPAGRPTTGLDIDVAVLNAGIGQGGAFTDTAFAEALREKVEDTGLHVTAFLPGPTDTDFFRRPDRGDTKVGTMDKDNPDDVARQAYEVITHGRAPAVTGSLKTRAQGLANTVLPDRARAALHRSMTEPGTAEDDERRP